MLSNFAYVNAVLINSLQFYQNIRANGSAKENDLSLLIDLFVKQDKGFLFHEEKSSLGKNGVLVHCLSTEISEEDEATPFFCTVQGNASFAQHGVIHVLSSKSVNLSPKAYQAFEKLGRYHIENNTLIKLAAIAATIQIIANACLIYVFLSNPAACLLPSWNPLVARISLTAVTGITGQVINSLIITFFKQYYQIQAFHHAGLSDEEKSVIKDLKEVRIRQQNEAKIKRKKRAHNAAREDLTKAWKIMDKLSLIDSYIKQKEQPALFQSKSFYLELV